MASPKWLLVLVSFTLPSCAAGGWRAGAGVDTLDLYADAYASAGLGFSCTPPLHEGGPSDPHYDFMRRALRERRFRVRERLVAEFGAARIDELERTADEQEHGVYRTGCDLDETARARTWYQRVLHELEIRTHIRAR